MTLVVIYGIALLVAVLFSEWSRRTLLSSAVLFLATGLLVGPAGFGLLHVGMPLVREVSDLALFAILFTDGLKLAVADIRSAWRLPGRALLIGMPATTLAIALLARAVVGLPWAQALLVGAILSPTDPVFAAAIVGREEIPWRVRHLLNLESGLNDGLALPVVIALIAFAAGGEWSLADGVVEVGGGLALGASVGAGAGLVRNLRVFAVARSHEPLLPMAIALIILGSAELLGVNHYLAAFAGGIALASVSSRARDEFHDVGDRIGVLLKLAAVLIVAVAVSELAPPGWLMLLFAVLVLGFARSVPILLALVGSGLPRDERLVAAWFGPKGFASIVYGLMALRSPIDGNVIVFHLVAVVVMLSIVLHSSSDVPVANYFDKMRSR